MSMKTILSAIVLLGLFSMPALGESGGTHGAEEGEDDSSERFAPKWELSSREDGVTWIRPRRDAADPAPLSVQELLKFIDSLQMTVPKRLDGIVFTEVFFDDPILQRELLAELSKIDARVLEEALGSPGNLHHPKMVALRSAFEEALLATASVRAVDERLNLSGFEIVEVSHEKLFLDKKVDPPVFRAMVWLMVKARAGGG